MLPRRARAAIEARLAEIPAVALLGPRQVGKTTLALEMAETRPGSIYLDLEAEADRARLSDPSLYLGKHEDTLVVLDEVHRMPGLFQELRGLVDRGRRRGRRTGRFLLLGSASPDLLRQSGESLAGRIAYVELAPFDPLEVPAQETERLWIRGGFPNSFLAASDAASLAWRRDFVCTYLERDVPQFGPRVPVETLRRFWTMLAHLQGGLLNAADLARSLAVDAKTVARYLDLLVDLLLVRRLPPVHANVGKRLVKSPKAYVRDSGLVHALLGLGNLDAVLSHPVAGVSWEGHAIEALLGCTPPGTDAGFYRTAAGAEIDLVLDLPDGRRWAVEVKRGTAPRPGRGFHQAVTDLRPTRSFVVYGGAERYPLSPGVEAISVRELAAELAT